MYFPSSTIFSLFATTNAFNGGFNLLQFEQPELPLLSQIMTNKFLNSLDNFLVPPPKPIIFPEKNIGSLIKILYISLNFQRIIP